MYTKLTTLPTLCITGKLESTQCLWCTLSPLLLTSTENGKHRQEKATIIRISCVLYDRPIFIFLYFYVDISAVLVTIINHAVRYINREMRTLSFMLQVEYNRGPKPTVSSSVPYTDQKGQGSVPFGLHFRSHPCKISLWKKETDAIKICCEWEILGGVSGFFKNKHYVRLFWPWNYAGIGIWQNIFVRDIFATPK